MPRFEVRDTERARRLRNGATQAERHLWRYLQNRQLGGFRFTRQKQIGPYFADFLCRERRLVVELDGSQHEERADADARRTAYLEGEGYTVLRFWNDEATDDTDRVLARILAALEPLPSVFSPSRSREGARGVGASAKREQTSSSRELRPAARSARTHPLPPPASGRGE